MARARQSGYFARLASPVPPAAPRLAPVARPAAAKPVAPLEVFTPAPALVMPAQGVMPPSRTVAPVAPPETAGKAQVPPHGPVLTPAVSPRAAAAAPPLPTMTPAPDDAPALPSQASPVSQPHTATPHPAPRSAAPAWPGTPRPVLLPVNARSTASPSAPQFQAPAHADERLTPADTALIPEPPVPAAAIAPVPPALPVPAPAPPPHPAMAEVVPPPSPRLTAATLQPAAAEPAPLAAPRAQPAVPAAPSIHIGVVEVRAAPPPQIIAPRPARPASVRSASLSRGFGQKFGFGQS